MALITIVDGELSVGIEPEWGGKVISIFHQPTRHELLFQNHRMLPSAQPRQKQPFANWAFGWDDCFPWVFSGDNSPYSDHGAVWRQKFRITKCTVNSVTLSAESGREPWAFTKTFSICQGRLNYRFSVENRSEKTLAGFWTAHPLVRADTDMILRFPDDTDKRLTIDGVDFSPDSLPPWETTSKFWYPGPVSEGVCGIDYPGIGMSFRLNWDHSRLPYLGFWVTNGGFQGDVNVAWEPSDGYYDDPLTARRNNALPMFAPLETRHYAMEVFWGPYESTQAADSR